MFVKHFSNFRYIWIVENCLNKHVGLYNFFFKINILKVFEARQENLWSTPIFQVDIQVDFKNANVPTQRSQFKFLVQRNYCVFRYFWCILSVIGAGFGKSWNRADSVIENVLNMIFVIDFVFAVWWKFEKDPNSFHSWVFFSIIIEKFKLKTIGFTALSRLCTYSVHR